MAQTIEKQWQVRRPNGQVVSAANGSWTAKTDEVQSLVDGVMADLARAGAGPQTITIMERTVTTDISEEVVVGTADWPPAT